MRRTLICTAVLTLSPPAEAATITVQTVEGGDPVVVVEGPFKAGDENAFRLQTAPSPTPSSCFRAMAEALTPGPTSEP